MRGSLLLLGAAVVLAACTTPAGDGTRPDGSAPVPTTTVPPAARLTVHAVGEVTFDPAVVPEAAAAPETALAAVAGLFAADDLSIATLSCPVVPGTFERPSPCAEEALSALGSSGVDVVALANDALGGAEAEATAAAARARGLKPVGAGPDAAAAMEPALLEIGGRTVAVLSVSVVGPDEAFATATGPGIADGRDVLALGAAVLEAREEADLVVVTVHWGEEQAQEPSAEDVTLARALAEAGADVVLGHGPHRLHRLEAYETSLLYLSLGDFVAAGDPPPTADTAVARVVWTPDHPIVGCLLHATIATPGVPTLDDPASTICPAEG